jgi:hypothetical protein
VQFEVPQLSELTDCFDSVDVIVAEVEMG